MFPMINKHLSEVTVHVYSSSHVIKKIPDSITLNQCILIKLLSGC